jgi:hypothetical protein
MRPLFLAWLMLALLLLALGRLSQAGDNGRRVRLAARLAGVAN